MNSGDVRRALVRHLDWWSSFVIPEFNGMDVFQITKAGFGVEYEIKVSAADWRRDLAKPKWAIEREYISRFFFVVPGIERRAPGAAEIAYASAIRVPDVLPPGVGVMVVIQRGKQTFFCREVTAAKRVKVPEVPERVRRQAMEAFYYRFWRLEAEHRRILTDYREALDARNKMAEPEAFETWWKKNGRGGEAYVDAKNSWRAALGLPEGR